MTRTHEKAKTQGFTLIELSIVLVIIGILVSAAGIGWNSMLEGRRLAKTYSTLVQAKECLVKRMLYSNQFSSYTGEPEEGPPYLDCDDDTAPYDFDLTAKDVDACICNLRDAWGQNLYFIEGRAEDGTPLSDGTGDEKYISDNPAQEQNATNPDKDNSAITDKDGNDIYYVAFVLVSSGRNLYLDHSSYRGLFETAPGSGIIDKHATVLDYDTGGGTTNERPDFSDRDGTPPVGDPNVRDDVILTVTGPELMTLLTE